VINMTMKKYRLVLLVFIIAALVTTLVPVSFASAKTKTKKMKVYDQVIKKGKYVYCSDNYSIYKVNLKTNKVKRLTKPSSAFTMKLHGQFIYYQKMTWGMSNYLCRVKTSGKSNKVLVSKDDSLDYVISGKRIYYNTLDDDDKRRVYSIKLNGKNKKRANCKVKRIDKKTNKKGYKVINKESSDFDDFDGTGYVVSYLKKPNGKKVKLAKIYGRELV